MMTDDEIVQTGQRVRARQGTRRAGRIVSILLLLIANACAPRSRIPLVMAQLDWKPPKPPCILEDEFLRRGCIEHSDSCPDVCGETMEIVSSAYRYSEYAKVHEVPHCGFAVTKAISDWAAEQTLRVVRLEIFPSRVLVHLTHPAIKGFFELRYRVRDKLAQARFDYWDLKGRVMGAEHTQLFQESAMRRLSKLLLDAMRCDE